MGTVSEAVYKRLYEIMGDVSALDGNPDEISDNEKKEICGRFTEYKDSFVTPANTSFPAELGTAACLMSKRELTDLWQVVRTFKPFDPKSYPSVPSEDRNVNFVFDDNCGSNSFVGLEYCVGVKPNFWGIDQECKIRTPYDTSKLFRPPVLSPEYSGL